MKLKQKPKQTQKKKMVDFEALEGEEETTFVELMALEELELESGLVGGGGRGERRFMSWRSAYNPGSGQAYGGHVYAQAVWAASLTVEAGMYCHNVHGYFTLPGLSDRPYIYTITPLSSGKSYCTRNVTVRQTLSPPDTPPDPTFSKRDAEGEVGEIRFTCLVSFKRDEKKSDFEMKIGHQMSLSVQERFKDVLKDVDPAKLKRCPMVDSPWFERAMARYPDPHFFIPFPGLEMRKMDMGKWNEQRLPAEWTALTFYRPVGRIPEDLPNLHACAHLYASDRNSLFLVSNAVGFGDEVGNMGSLSHSVVLHGSSSELLLSSEGGQDGRGEWWIQEAWTPRSGQGRGIHESRIWNARGANMASSWQEGLVRRAEKIEDQRQRILWEDGMRKLGVPFGKKAQKEKLGEHKL